MYATIPNHLINFSRFAFAFVFVFGVFPYFIFAKQYKDKFEGIVSRFMKMVFLIIMIGYGLVITRLFEFLGILFFLAAAFIFSYIRRRGLPEISRITNFIHTHLYNLADGIIRPRDLVTGGLKRIKNWFKRIFDGMFGSIPSTGDTLLIIGTFIYSAYLRFYDTYLHAAPGMSDGNVTLVWLKYIQNRLLFHDGIYPQGFHICLAILQKFSAADSLYVLKYAGPLNGVLIALGMYFAVSRLTGRKGPGVIAAVAYGVFGQYLTTDWMRQGATNSQEFAFVFVIPVLYFFFKYLESLDKKYLVTAFAGITVTGLVHTLAFVFASGGVVAMIFSALLVDFKKYYKVSLKVLGLGIISGIITVLPLGIGIISGDGFHSSSAEYLTSRSIGVSRPVLIMSDYLAVASIILLYIYSLFSRRKRREKLMEKCFSAVGAFGFLLYYLGGYITKSIVIGARSGDLWSLVSPLCIGMGLYTLGNVTSRKTVVRIFDFSVCLIAICSALVYFKPSPVVTYKMQYNANVEQYLRITQIARPTEWRIIGQSEMYAFVYGTGYVDYVKDFLNDNNPEDKKISYVLNGNRIEVKDKYVFIFLEKKVFRTDFEELQPEYDSREKEKYALEDWIDKYSKTHDNISLFYEDDDIAVYEIYQPPTRDEVEDTIW